MQAWEIDSQEGLAAFEFCTQTEHYSFITLHTLPKLLNSQIPNTWIFAMHLGNYMQLKVDSRFGNTLCLLVFRLKAFKTNGKIILSDVNGCKHPPTLICS
jgi:hypothetical protein